MTQTPLLERFNLKRGRRSRTSSSSSSSSRSSAEQENIDLIQRGRSSSTVELFNHTVIPQIQDDMCIVDVVSGLIDVPRPTSPQAVNIPARARLPPVFRNINQNVIEPELVEPGDIPDEDTIVWVPSTAQPIVPIISPPPSILSRRVVEGADALNDPVLYIQLRGGFHHEVWDPNIRDGLVLWGQASYYPISSSLISPIQLSSELIWLSLEVCMAWPHKPLGQTLPDYVCLMKNNTLINVGPSSTISQNVNKGNPRPSQYRPVEYPMPSLIPTHAPCDLEVGSIEQHSTVQTCSFKLILPVGDPLLFRDSGAGDLTRSLKIRSKGIVRITSNDVVITKQSTKDVDVTVNVLRTPQFLDGIEHSSA